MDSWLSITCWETSVPRKARKLSCWSQLIFENLWQSKVYRVTQLFGFWRSDRQTPWEMQLHVFSCRRLDWKLTKYTWEKARIVWHWFRIQGPELLIVLSKFIISWSNRVEWVTLLNDVLSFVKLIFVYSRCTLFAARLFLININPIS